MSNDLDINEVKRLLKLDGKKQPKSKYLTQEQEDLIVEKGVEIYNAIKNICKDINDPDPLLTFKILTMPIHMILSVMTQDYTNEQRSLFYMSFMEFFYNKLMGDLRDRRLV